MGKEEKKEIKSNVRIGMQIMQLCDDYFNLNRVSVSLNYLFYRK